MTVRRPPSNLIACKIAHLVYLCDRMRADEIEQYTALIGPWEPEAAVAGFIAMPGIKFTLVDDDSIPVVAGGWHEVNAGVWQSWMVGTDGGWARNWRGITKASRWVMDGLFANGARRLQTNCLASRTRAIEWYERSLGLVREGTWARFGANGEDVATFARLA